MIILHPLFPKEKTKLLIFFKDFSFNPFSFVAFNDGGHYPPIFGLWNYH